jgi:hypothetical protein
MSQETNSTLQTSIPTRITAGNLAPLAALLVFVPYFLTLNPTFGFIDKGELVAVASTLGIAHPTGYPTIMSLGYLFTHILPVRPVYALNIMAALLTAASAGVLTLLFDDLLRRVSAVRQGRGKGGGKKKRDRSKGKEESQPLDRATIPPQIRALYAALGAMAVAFTSTWWDQGNGFEVYSLHALMMPLVTLLFLRYIDEEAAREEVVIPGRSHVGAVDERIGFTRRGIIFALMLGLSFTNHLTTILLAPAFLVYYFWTLGTGQRSWRRLVYLAPFFLLGLSPYALLPIRASMHPYFNWGDPETAERFFNHVRGKQYGEWMFESWEVFGQQTAYFFNNLPSQAAYVGLVLAMIGIVQLARRSGKLSLFVGLLLVACIIYSGGFAIMEIGPYYMTAIFAIGIWMVAGTAFLHERFGPKPALAVAVALALLGCAINYHESDEKGNVLVEDMTVNMLKTLPQNALVLSSQWDFWVSGSWYMQAVENMRPDVLTVDNELLRRSWYLDQLEHNHPEFMAKLRPELDRFRPLLYKFEHGESYDPAAIESAYNGLINAMVEKNIASRPVHITSEVNSRIDPGFQRVPYYLTLRLTRDSSYLPQDFPNYQFHRWEGRVNGYAAKVYELYAVSLFNRLSYEAQSGRDSLARRYADYIFTFDPHYSVDGIPDEPLNGEDRVREMIATFDQLREKVAALKGGNRTAP